MHVLVFGALLPLAVGCASPGPPRPPSLHIPNPVAAFSAERHGPSVLLSFTAPSRTTDGMGLTAPVRLTLCRAVARAACTPTESYPAPVAVAPGSLVEWNDVLPDALATGAPRRLTYTLIASSATGRVASRSPAAVAAAGATPPPVTGLHAEGSRDGIVLRWTALPGSGAVLLRRETDMPPAPAAAPARAARPAAANASRHKHGPAFATPASGRPAEAPGVVWLQAGEAPSMPDSGGAVDATAMPGVLYRYSAVRSRRVVFAGPAPGQTPAPPVEIRGPLSAPVAYTLHDVYPPAAPTGLQAAPYDTGSGFAVDLLWQPSPEADLGGYIVARQRLTEAGAEDGPPRQLNPAPLPLPSFHDTAVTPGARFRYTVVAVDRSGNRSVPSAPVEAEVPAAP